MSNLIANLPLTIPIRGDISVTVRDSETNELLTKFTKKNTIVYKGLTSIIYLLSQNSGDPAASTFNIASLRVGTGTIPPTRADTSLVASVFTAALLSADRVVIPSTSQLSITKTIVAGDANGNVLTEAGLFLTNGTLFARQIHPAITKTGLITVTYEWVISFTS